MCKVNCARRRTAWPLIEPRVILRDAYASYIHRENHLLYLIHRLSIRCNLLYTTKRVPANRKKIEALRSSGALNRHPEKVRHSLFAQHDFFDPHDLVQLKYETVRAVELDGHPIAQAALDFGLSRPTIYEAQQKLRQAGVEGLLPQKRGPKKARKLTPDVRRYVEELVGSEPDLQTAVLVQRVQTRFGIVLHPRTVEKAVRKKGRHRP
jgi:transposase